MPSPEPNKDRRRQILAAAERLLRRYGFSKTTVADIAREVGIGVGSFYLEFPSKEAVVGELSLVNHRDVLERMKSVAQRRGSHAARLKNMLEERLIAFGHLTRNGEHASDLVHCACSTVRAAHNDFNCQEQLLVADLLEDAERAGEFSVPQSPLTVAKIILGLYDGFLGRAEPVEEEELDATHRLILRGLLRR